MNDFIKCYKVQCIYCFNSCLQKLFILQLDFLITLDYKQVLNDYRNFKYKWMQDRIIKR